MVYTQISDMYAVQCHEVTILQGPFCHKQKGTCGGAPCETHLVAAIDDCIPTLDGWDTGSSEIIIESSVISVLGKLTIFGC